MDIDYAITFLSDEWIIANSLSLAYLIICLLIGKSCPWCHRTFLVHRIKNLSKQVKLVFLNANLENGEWIFDEKFKGCNRLTSFYKKVYKKKTCSSSFVYIAHSSIHPVSVQLLPVQPIFNDCNKVWQSTFD